MAKVKHNIIIIALIVLYSAVILVGCTPGAESNSSSKQESSQSASISADEPIQSEPQSMSESEGEEAVSVASAAVFAPLGLPEPEADWPVCLSFASKPELDAFYKDNVDRLGLDYGLEGQRFLDYIDRYDEAYFRENALVIVLFGESDSSTTHRLESVTVQNGALQINILRDSPEIVLTALAQWAALVEVDASYGSLPATVVFM